MRHIAQNYLRFTFFLKTLNNLLILKFSIFTLVIVVSITLLISPREHIFFNLILLSSLMILVRSFGMCINNLIDSEIDKRNPRTQKRAIPSGSISKRKVIYIIVAIFCAYLFLLYFFFSIPILLIAMLPILATTIYPYAKRITALSHFVLASIHSMLPWGIYICTRAEKYWFYLVLLSSLFLFLLISSSDIVYSSLDRDFDIKSSLYSASTIFHEEALCRIMLVIYIAIIAIYIELIDQLKIAHYFSLFLVLLTVLGMLFFLSSLLLHNLSKLKFFFYNLLMSSSFSVILLYKVLLFF
jgi:4-hydroxybenzoate polyprenyltransferase